MKKLITILILIALSIGLMAQENHPKGIYVGKKSSTPVTSNIVKIDSIILLNNKIYFFVAGDTVDFGTLVANQIALSSVAYMLTDTSTHIGIGHGSAHSAADTAGFALGYDLGGTFLDGSDTTLISKTILVLEASKNAPSCYINVYWGTTYGTPLDSLYTNPLQITSTTTGTAGTTGFKNQKVPPQRWIWAAVARTPTLGAKPQFSRGAIVKGLLIPKY